MAFINIVAINYMETLLRNITDNRLQEKGYHVYNFARTQLDSNL